MMGDQEEALTSYLESVGLKTLIRDMTMDLSDSMPEEPIGHLIKFLHAKYPTEAKAAKTGGPLAGSSSLTAMMDAPEEARTARLKLLSRCEVAFSLVLLFLCHFHQIAL